MDATLYDIRLARPDDIDSLRASVRKTLNNPEGKSTSRKTFADAIGRGELLVLAGRDAIHGFVEWHSRVDGGITIRDAGWAGDEPGQTNVGRLVRELLGMARPTVASVKLESDNEAWEKIFKDTYGFRLEGREYSQRKWRHIWSWTPEDEALDRQRAASQRAPARPAAGAPGPGGPPRPMAPRPPMGGARPFGPGPRSGAPRPGGPRPTNGGQSPRDGGQRPPFRPSPPRDAQRAR